MNIRQITHASDIEDTMAIQKAAWGARDIDLVPGHILKGLTDNGSLILGAYEGEEMLGYVLCIPTDQPAVHLAHMMGVHPDHQQSDVGGSLLRELVTRARERGVEKLVWTFDPLESVNAKLYFHKMGAVARRYVPDYYIMHGSRAHAGLPADRFKVELFVAEELKPKFSEESREVWIPSNILELKEQSLNEARVWREKTRAIFTKYVNTEGFLVADFVYQKGEPQGYYLLKQEAASVHRTLRKKSGPGGTG